MTSGLIEAFWAIVPDDYFSRGDFSMGDSNFSLRRSEIVRQGRKLRFCTEYYQIGGKDFEFEKVEHPGAVVILPVTAEGNFLLVRQYRFAIRKPLLEFPAGTLDRQGEDPADCAVRELAEEVGQAAESWSSLGVIHPAPGFCDEVQHLFLARGLSPSIATPDEDEFLATVILTKEELSELIASGEMTDAKSIAIFCRAQLAGLV